MKHTQPPSQTEQQPGAGPERPVFSQPLADAGVCEDCLAELRDPSNRRHGHPFISCAACGPRYSIITELPYDRPNTTMAPFVMCPQCGREYEDAASRRFQAPAIACPDCGPKLRLLDAKGRELSGDPVARAAELLAEGNILAIKGVGGFHLAVNAMDQEALLRLRRRIRHDEKPLAVMVGDLDAARGLVSLDQTGERLLSSPARPIVLAPMKPDHGLPEALAPNMNQLGVMLPHTPLHHLLLDHGPKVLAMAPGNLHDEPVYKKNSDALANLGQAVDFFLLHNLKIHRRADDSICTVMLGQSRMIRRSRGYAPESLRLAEAGPDILALGPELRNTVCLTRGDEAFVSPQVGDLQDAETLDYYLGIIERLQKQTGSRPEAVAVDLHPDYLSSRQAVQFNGLPLIKVQHHAAHALSVMAELGLGGPVIALVLDGGGYGLDGSVWGGEILGVGPRGMTRLGRLTPACLPGGDRVALEPWRGALGRLYACYGPDWQSRVPEKLSYFMLRKVDPYALRMLQQMLEGGVNAPWSSSAGRLFDAIAALCGLRHMAAYDGQAAMELEAAAARDEESAYPMRISLITGAPRPGLMELNPKPMLDAMLSDLEAGAAMDTISARFHNGLISGLAHAAAWAAQSCGLKDVVLSGGSMMNRILLEGLSRRLEKMGLSPHSPSHIPCNDSGISLGQALGARLALKAGDLELWTREAG